MDLPSTLCIIPMLRDTPQGSYRLKKPPFSLAYLPIAPACLWHHATNLYLRNFGCVRR